MTVADLLVGQALLEMDVNPVKDMSQAGNDIPGAEPWMNTSNCSLALGRKFIAIYAQPDSPIPPREVMPINEAVHHQVSRPGCSQRLAPGSSDPAGALNTRPLDCSQSL